MTDEKKDDNKVTDLKPDLPEAVKAAMPPPDPTHWALPIGTMQKIIRYLKKQPMEDIEELVYAIQNERVPLALAPPKSNQG